MGEHLELYQIPLHPSNFFLAGSHCGYRIIPLACYTTYPRSRVNENSYFAGYPTNLGGERLSRINMSSEAITANSVVCQQNSTHKPFEAHRAPVCLSDEPIPGLFVCWQPPFFQHGTVTGIPGAGSPRTSLGILLCMFFGWAWFDQSHDPTRSPNGIITRFFSPLATLLRTGENHPPQPSRRRRCQI